MNKVNFKSMRLKIASPEEILKWSHGEVLKPETINYRTQRPEKDGLFCERIFGPTKDWECYCGKFKRIRYKGVVCDKCGVEITHSSVRRERMGHIRLAAPVAHIWFLRNVPSKIGLVLATSSQKIERVIYFASYIIISIDEQARQRALKEINKEFKLKSKDTEQRLKIKRENEATKQKIENLQPLQILSEIKFREISMEYGQVFRAGTGAEAIREILEGLDLNQLTKEILGDLRKKKGRPEKQRLLKRLHLIQAFKAAGIRPEWMILTVLPVLPPELRPMVQLDGGRFATSDLNDLYRRIISRNNRLKRLKELGAPEVICRNEKRMLQEAVDALIDNTARHGQVAVAASTGGRRALRSLADMLRGKQGRFRQNLLGKRVDYSGRSVIVSGPELKLHQCGLPKKMALELFRPFITQKLIERELAHNIRSAGKLIEEEEDVVWDILEEVIKDSLVLLNRAPTLHRLSIQAFEPVLIEGKAIQIHPLVCPAFNADFDGDQMAVYLPLAKQAQEEARKIMLSSVNLLKPATGEPIVIPSKDMVWGCYWMTAIQKGLKGEGKIFNDMDEAVLAYQFGLIDLGAEIKVRDVGATLRGRPQGQTHGSAPTGSTKFITTSVGRIIFNQALPEELPFINQLINVKSLKSIIARILAASGQEQTALVVDQIKELGFYFATQSGFSWGMNDLCIPAPKAKLLSEASQRIKVIQEQYQSGLLTDDERKDRVVEIWAETKGELADIVKQSLDPYGSVYSMVDSGSRGSWELINQMMGMKGLVVNPLGEIIEMPIRSSFKEGFDALEYFISTHGTRKGMADTALRTATAGYLTRRLVDVAQDVIVLEKDCGTNKGTIIYQEDCSDIGQTMSERLLGRTALKPIKGIIKKGQQFTKEQGQKVEARGIKEVQIRSVVTCQTRFGVCQQCYGYDLGKNQLVERGQAVGVVAAQAIGEPGTQLTLRTFHAGGIAGKSDITQGLPRVEEIFEARPPKGEAVMADDNGKVIDIVDEAGQRIIKVQKAPSETRLRQKPKSKIQNYLIPKGVGLWVEKGERVVKGQQLCEGHLDLQKLDKLTDRETVQRYITNGVQSIYSSEGAAIHDKHIEVIIRQMFSRLRIKDRGDSDFLNNEIVEKDIFEQVNQELKKKNKKPAMSEQLLLGITKVCLSTASFLSAASFQETARVLINAACLGKEDVFRGLKENVIAGKLIPAGTGFGK